MMGKDDGKLGRMLSMVDAETWAQFRIFLQSPWFNRSASIRELAERMQADLLKQENPLSDEALFEALYPGERFDPTKLKNLRAGLQRKLDDGQRTILLAAGRGDMSAGFLEVLDAYQHLYSLGYKRIRIWRHCGHRESR